jgi:hypothetical protein
LYISIAEVIGVEGCARLAVPPLTEEAGVIAALLV